MVNTFNSWLKKAYGYYDSFQKASQASRDELATSGPLGPLASALSYGDYADSPLSSTSNAGLILSAAGLPQSTYLSDGALDEVTTRISDASDHLGEIFDRPVSATNVSRAQLAPETLDYLNADLARSYGMDRTTAYQEALSNTSYQRAVKDMQAAGLNPAALFGNGRVSGAGGVAYASPAGSGGSGGGFGGKSNNGKLFSEGAYAGISTAAGIAAAAITGNVYNYWLGSTAAKGVMTAMDGLSKVF